MTQIGSFTRSTSGFSGQVQTLSFRGDLALVPADPGNAASAPDYRIHLGDNDGPEIGAAWKRTGEKAGDYLALLIDDPAFAQPMRANLFQSDADKSAWVLTWNRTPKRAERE